MNGRRSSMNVPGFSAAGGRRDGGFTLVEALLSITMISIVGATLTLFYVKASVSTALQSQAQLANQIASAAMEQVSQLPGDALVAGRPACLMTAQWAQTSPPVPAGVSKFFTSMSPAADQRLASLVCPVGSALQALLTSQAKVEALPTQEKVPIKVNDFELNFTKSFYVGLCWQNRGTGYACVKPNLATVPAGMVPMLRVVVAVTWESARCPLNSDGVRRCAYVTDTLVHLDLIDPTFS